MTTHGISLHHVSECNFPRILRGDATPLLAHEHSQATNANKVRHNLTLATIELIREEYRERNTKATTR